MAALSALALLAGSGLLQNTGLQANTNLLDNINSYENTDVINQFDAVVGNATGKLNSSVLTSLRILSANVFPAITNTIPGNAAPVLGSTFTGGFTGLIEFDAVNIMGNGDLGKFGQVVTSSLGYISQANEFVATAATAETSNNNFPNSQIDGVDGSMTGSFSQVSSDLPDFGTDLVNLGNLIDLDDLNSLGLPSSLLRRIGQISTAIPALTELLGAAGISTATVASLYAGTGVVPANLEKNLYDAMKQVNGDLLLQVLSVLSVSTNGIDTMADLLDPKKLFPNSYLSLTLPTPDGTLPIYLGPNSINTNIEKYLQDVGVDPDDDPVIKARLRGS